MAAREVLAEAATDQSDIGVALFSALKREGVDEAAVVLHGWAQQTTGDNGAGGLRPA